MIKKEEEILIYEPDMTLKERIGKAGLKRLTNSLILEQAEKVVDGFGNKILKALSNEVITIERILTTLKKEGTISPDSMKKLVSSAFFIKSNAGFCDYQLISAIGKSLYLYCETSRKKGQMDAKEIAIINWHIESIKTILEKQIKAGGGAFGRELLIQLDKFKMKFVDKTIAG